MSPWRRWVIRGVVVVVCAALASLILALILTLPTPTISRAKWQDTGLQLRGTANPRLAILLFDEQGQLIASTSTDSVGSFSFDRVPVPSSTRTLVIRVTDGGWRASPPERVHLGVASEAGSSSSSVISADDQGDLPPLGIPPKSSTTTRHTTETTSSTSPVKSPVIMHESSTTSTSAILPPSMTMAVYLRSTHPQAGSVEPISAVLKDGRGQTISGANVHAVIHFASGDINITLLESGSLYNGEFSIPASSEGGNAVSIDLTADNQGLTASAQTHFTPQ